MRKPLKLDPEDYLSWREHPVTREVLQYLQGLAASKAEQVKTNLFHSAGMANSPEWTWEAQRPDAAFQAGQCDMVDHVLGLTADDINGPEEEDEKQFVEGHRYSPYLDEKGNERPSPF